MIYYHQYFEMASVIAGIIFFSSLKKEKMFVFFLLCIISLSVDLISTYLISAGYNSNYFIINLYPLTAAPLIFYGFFTLLNLSSRNAAIYRIVATTACAAFFINYFFGEGINKLNTFSILFFYFFNIFLSSGMLFKMAMREDYFLFVNEPAFWVSAGLLIFSLGALVVMGMNQFIRINQITIRNVTLYRIIMPVLNVILYSSFTYAFVLCGLRKKSYSQSLS